MANKKHTAPWKLAYNSTQMEFLDPKKQKAYLIRLTIGYVLVGMALVLTTIILLYHAYGFGIKNGEVIQNGLIFVSTNPRPTDIYVNDQKHKETTNTRLLMPAGQYKFRLERPGYHAWKRAINVEGGAIVRFDYPVLFPAELVTATTKKYDAKPGLVSQSPNRRWLIVQSGSNQTSMELFDLNDPRQAPAGLILPPNVLGLTAGTHSWESLEWANDNRHVLLRHTTDNKGVQASEYILLDREDIQASRNLTTVLGLNPTKIELRDKKFDKYFLYDQAAQILTTATLENPIPQPYLSGVLSFKTHGRDRVLFITDRDSLAGKVAVKLFQEGKTYPIRQVTVGATYLLDITQYSGAWYIVTGAPNENRTYVYKNPASTLSDKPKEPLVPVQVLKTTNPNHVSFSDNARFIVVEQGQQFSVYDAETDKGYAYTLPGPMDPPQTHATWMDGHRMMYVSNGTLVVFDFDNTNQQKLGAADPAFIPVFDREYTFIYSFVTSTAQAANGTGVFQFALNNTALLAPQDQ